MDSTWEQEPWELWRFISWSLDFFFFFFVICFDVSVDVDLDDYRLYSENIVKQCLLSAPLFCFDTVQLLHFSTLLSASALSRSPLMMQMILWLIKNSSSL